MMYDERVLGPLTVIRTDKTTLVIVRQSTLVVGVAVWGRDFASSLPR